VKLFKLRELLFERSDLPKLPFVLLLKHPDLDHVLATVMLMAMHLEKI
jgi:hypothetical protein